MNLFIVHVKKLFDFDSLSFDCGRLKLLESRTADLIAAVVIFS